ncbi:ATP-binding protein [Actibacterium sp. 188UL27-1]|uniref:sensor histidine kinase n=1 Tax=Actibacterium sp. 188UL27-1 TaxID=2786961 RepID=UPI00195D1C0D|nr:ATP-binding protein [Actibacterium sp. 188UL27-1]MBM7070258.1 sensor histidine kinase [Actibacterium sp. 188UL27-1]
MVRIYAALLIIALAFVGHALGQRAALQDEALRARGVLTRASDRLSGLVDRYRYLPAVLARSADLQAAPDAVSLRLGRIADTSGALAISLLDPQGRIMAHSEAAERPRPLTQDRLWRPSFRRALDGGLGISHEVTPDGQRIFTFEHPVATADGQITGVIAIALDVEEIEGDLRGDRDVIFFTDGNGVIFISNRDQLTLRTMAEPVTEIGQYGGAVPEVSTGRMDRRHGVPVMRGIDVPGLPAEAIHYERQMARIGMQAHILTDTAPALVVARTWGLIGALAGGVAALVLALMSQRRATTLARLAERAAAQGRLEAKVAARTAELSETNLRLSREVDERIQAEAELRRVQGDLVQAGKLTALGEMSAGISHELNQPLTAIQTLADTSQLFVDRAEPGEVRRNLGRISELAQRAGGILKSLRAFARKEGERPVDVDLADVVADALGLLEQRLEGVVVHWAPRPGLMVRGGRVQLQQVVVNLLTNAADAMEGGRAEIFIEIATQADHVTLSVRDTGPGLVEADRIFDPFHTTKPVGQGLGLGLSISYGIVQSFGGQITGANADGGGAIFTVHLTPAAARAAA